MKKIVLGVMLLIGIGSAQVSAQSISGGVKVEANMSNFLLSDMSGAKSKMGFGVSVGGFGKVDIVRNFALQPELLFHFQNSKMEQKNGKKRDFEYWGVEIPVYAVGQWYTGKGDRFYAGLGPYVGYGFNAKFDKPKQKLYKDDTLQHGEFGFKVMGGYEFTNKIQVNAGYKIGIINAVDKGNGKMRPEVVSLGIGYRF